MSAAVAVTRDWSVLHKARASSASELWALVIGVPREVKREGVAEALESWSRWPAWQARLGINGRVTIVPKQARHLTALRVPLEQVTLAWEDLAPAQRRLTVPLEGRLYARITRTARAEGVSLNAWASRVLAAAAGDELADVIAQPFVDVPLPGVE